MSLLGRVRYPSPYRELSARGRLPVERAVYGADGDQRVEVRRPPSGAPQGVAVLFHGGFWREVWRCDLMNALAVDLATRGWVTWNVEYRRVRHRGDSWPDLLEDAGAGVVAVDGAGSLAGLPLVLAGHSAGGHLALWVTARLRSAAAGTSGAAADAAARVGARIAGVVGLAAVSDLRAAGDAHLGGDAVADLLGGTAHAVPDRLEAADPLRMLPLGVPWLLVHGDADEAVPPAMSRATAGAARAAGDDVDLLELPGVGHSALVDPSRPFWAEVRAWMEARVR